MTACPSRAQLHRLLAEQLPEEEERELASHLEACPACQQVLEVLTAATVLDSQVKPFEVDGSSKTAVESPAPSGGTFQLDVDFRRHLQEQLATEVTPRDSVAVNGEREPAPVRLETELPEIPGYEIRKELGRGGMGVVYKARHIKLNRLVALKMILADGFAPAPHLARFLVEGEMIARLQHPHIVQIYQVGQHRGRPFFELEYVAGGTLAGLLKNGSLPLAASLRLVQQLANAVQYAHSQGIVHRDLKPANVLLQKDESPSSSFVPKITDFGLAKQVQLRSDLTSTGMVLGTPSYMAPEQAEASRNVGPAADIHALGAILYELLTGRPPFKADSPMATVVQVLNDEPTPPRRLRPQIAVDLETICLKCLQKDPQQRYRSAAELEDDLGRFQRGEPIRARAVGWWESTRKWARRRPALASLLATIAVLVVTSFAVITWLWKQAEYKTIAEENAKSNAQQHALREQLARQELQRLTVGVVVDQGQRLAAAGDVDQGLLFMARALELAADAENADLDRVARINLASWQQQLVRLRGQFKHRGWVWSAAFSPDSKTVVTAGADKVARRWSLTSGKEIEPPLPHAYPVWSAAFSPDGRFVLTGAGGMDGTGGEAKLWDAATGAPIHHSSMVHKTRVNTVAFHPDGNVFLTVALDGAQIWNTATCQAIGPVLEHKGLSTGCLSPTGRWVATTGSDGVARMWETSSGRRVTELRHGASVEAVAFSPDESIVVTGDRVGAARLWNTDTWQFRKVAMLHRGPVRCVAFSPDGKLIASGAAALEVQPRFTGGETRLWDAATGELRFPPITCSGPVWSVAFNPNGRLLLTGSQDGGARLYWTASGRQVGRTLAQEGTVANVIFSPDGRYALAASAGGDQSAAARLLDVSQASVLAKPWPHRANYLAVSPDGGTMLTARKERARLWDRTSAEPIGEEVDHGREINYLAFHPNNQVFATVGDNGSVRIWDRATQRQLAACSHSRVVWIFAFTTDGAGFLTVCDNVVHEWKLSGEAARPPRNLEGRVATLDPKRRIAWVVSDGQLTRWDLASFEATKSWRIPDPEGGVKSSPDGRTVLTGVRAAKVQLWDTSTGKPKGPPLTHDGEPILFAEFSPDNRIVATCSDGSVQLWDVETARALGWPILQNDRPLRVAFLPDGQTLIVHGKDQGQLILWPIPQPLLGTPAEIRAQIERMTGLTLDSEGVIRPRA
jgi:eukaryotic-like serine/threonine-protein kinase